MQKQVLVVDDDPLFLDLVTDMFAIEEVEVIPALDATDALSVLKVARPSFIVSDFEMPGMNGIEFHSHLLRDQGTKNIPFCFMTGTSDQVLMEYTEQHHLRLLSKNNLVRGLIGLLNELK